MASQIAKFAAANTVTWLQKDLAIPKPFFFKSVTSSKLVINFARCTIPDVNDLLSDLQNHLEVFLAEYQGTKDIQINLMNCDTKNSQRVLVVFYF